MNIIKLGKRGQVYIPKEVLERLGLKSESVLLVDTTDDGAITLRPAGVYPLEMYSDVRIKEFLDEDVMLPELAERVRARLAKGP